MSIEDNGIRYDQDGVIIRHWRRAHGKDGASAYRLDWNGLSFVWTGDGRPDANTVKYSQGVDVFVTEFKEQVEETADELRAKINSLRESLKQKFSGE